MTSSPDFTVLPNRQLPGGDALMLVDTLGPLKLVRSAQPLIKVALTPLEGQETHLTQRLPKWQRVVDLHVADLMAVGPGTLIYHRLIERHPRGFLQKLNIGLPMSVCEVKTFQDLSHIFGPQGAYPLTSTWPMIQPLKCLSFATDRGTVLIPCLDAWRFTLATSSSLLDLSTQPQCENLLTTARSQSFLETPEGQIMPLPLTAPPLITPEDHRQWRELIQSSTLHLSVPPGFSEHELPFLNWCVVDDLAFQAVTRFYTSLVANRPRNKSAQARGTLSYPDFRFPFAGVPQFRLQGTWLTTTEGRYFLTLHIDKCQADVALPQHIIHTLPTSYVEDPPAEVPSKTPHSQWRGRKPSLDMEVAEVDSLTPPESRLVTLHFGLRRQRLPHLQGLKLAGQDRPEGASVPTRLRKKSEPERNVSLGEEEPGGLGGRRVKVDELPQTPDPPEQRPVEHATQFCNLLGVCQKLQAMGLSAEFLPLGQRVAGDPTTLIPAVAGAAANWVGQGIASRRALIARLSYDGQIAYAVEWERVKPKEYGRLLLCTAGQMPIPHAVLLHLLSECAKARGVWPDSLAENEDITLVGISHRTPHDHAMSKFIYERLIVLGWPFPEVSNEEQNYSA